MIIVDKKKEYYDYLVKSLGVDKSIVYERNKAKEVEVKGVYTPGSFPYIPTGLVVEKQFVLVVDGDMYPFTSKGNIFVANALSKCNYLSPHSYRYKVPKPDQKMCFYSRELQKIQEDSKQPVLILEVSGYYVKSLQEWEHDPNLDSTKFRPSPEEMYTTLYNFFSRIKDCNPPVDLTDKERLEKHGFDHKTSFRGSTKSKRFVSR